ncbi:MAG: hypothetical protein FWD48_01025 [Oscillospiraceae bacterium]|nr:hypothetical protein [Oscillospiraceae bacterium]
MKQKALNTISEQIKLLNELDLTDCDINTVIKKAEVTAYLAERLINLLNNQE